MKFAKLNRTYFTTSKWLLSYLFWASQNHSMTTMFDLFGCIARRRKTQISRLSWFRLLSAYLILKQKTWISLTTKSALSKSQIIHVTANCLLVTKTNNELQTKFVFIRTLLTQKNVAAQDKTKYHLALPMLYKSS